MAPLPRSAGPLLLTVQDFGAHDELAFHNDRRSAVLASSPADLYWLLGANANAKIYMTILFYECYFAVLNIITAGSDTQACMCGN